MAGKRLQARIKKRIALQKLLKDINKLATKSVPSVVKNVIQDTIIQGRSPVDGVRWKSYAPSYEALKGKKRPVDMLLTAEMLDSIKVKKKFFKKTSWTVVFTDKPRGNSKYPLSVIHDKKGVRRGRKKKSGSNKGRHSLVIRRLLPRIKGEKFRPSIFKAILRELNRITANAVKKQNNKANA